MSLMKKQTKTPRDTYKLASMVVAASMVEEQPENDKPLKNPAAVELGRLGGLKGGKARASKLSAKERRMIAIKAAHARWSKTQE
jgi:hypothetical protein